MTENIQDIADNKNEVMSSEIGKIHQKNEGVKRSWQKRKTSKLEPKVISAEQNLSHVTAVPERKTKRPSVSGTEVGK